MDQARSGRALYTDFKGVRAAAALARLPEAERQEWHRLWQEVEQLRLRAEDFARGGKKKRKGCSPAVARCGGSLNPDRRERMNDLSEKKRRYYRPPLPGL